MSEELAGLFAEKYPRGFSDYLDDVTRYTKPDGTPFYAVTIETPTDVYLVKINIKTDDLEDVEKWLNEESGQEDETDAGGESEGAPLPDDNISQYGGDDDSADA